MNFIVATKAPKSSTDEGIGFVLHEAWCMAPCAHPFVHRVIGLRHGSKQLFAILSFDFRNRVSICDARSLQCVDFSHVTSKCEGDG